MKYLILAGLVVAGMITARADAPPDAAPPSPGAASSPVAPDASPADKAWANLTSDLHSLKAQGGAEPSQKEITTLLAETHDFYMKYPDDERAVNAVMLWAQLGGLMLDKKWDGAPKPTEIEQTFDGLATNKKVPETQRAEIRAMEIEAALQQVATTPGDDKQWDALEGQFTRFDKEFGPAYAIEGHGPVVAQLRNEELQVLASSPDQARYNALVTKLAASSDPQIAAMAQQVQDQIKLVAGLKLKPLDLKFTAVDGKKIDLSKMRGKVVLVDFWATWCPPCREEVPDVVSTYRKLHDKGFEVVGISLDQDKDKLLAFTKENGMTWPQYFDGKGWDNDISKGYGITSIPTMWLIDKKGMLVSTNGGDDLAGQVEKLLAAPELTATP